MKDKKFVLVLTGFTVGVLLVTAILMLIRESNMQCRITSASYHRSSFLAGSLPIPQVVHQSWYTKDLSPFLTKIRVANQELNPGVHFVLYDDRDAHSLIRSHFEPSVYEAYVTLNPKLGALRADFFRYCVLYLRGGVYMDIKIQCKTKLFGRLVLPDDLGVLDEPRLWTGSRSVLAYHTHEQWAMAFVPRHPYMLRMITRLVERISARVTPVRLAPCCYTGAITVMKDRVMRLTGPDALAQAIRDITLDAGIQHRSVRLGDYLRYKEIISEYRDGRLHYSLFDEATPLYVEARLPSEGEVTGAATS